MLYDPATREFKCGSGELLDEWQSRQKSLLWADLWGEDPESEKRILLDRFGFHPMAIQDAQRLRHPPKMEAFDDHTFILLKGLGQETPDFAFETIQIALFVGEHFLVTRHSDNSPSIEKLRQEVNENMSIFARGPDALALRLSRIAVDRYLKKMLSLEPRIETLEQDMIVEPRDEMLAELIGYKTQLRKFRRVFLYQVQIFSNLNAQQPPGITAERLHEITDVYENQDRANSLATLYYELASDLIDGYISLASHRLNNIIKVLTIVTAIFVPLSFLAGVYGMNFENMPELHSRFGYFILLAVMAGIVTVLLIIFRKRRWL